MPLFRDNGNEEGFMVVVCVLLLVFVVFAAFVFVWEYSLD